MSKYNIKVFIAASAGLLDGIDVGGIDTEATETKFKALLEAEVAKRYVGGGLTAEDFDITAYYGGSRYESVLHRADTGVDIDNLEFEDSEIADELRELRLDRQSLDDASAAVFDRGEFYVPIRD